MLFFFLTNMIVLSMLHHKESRFITNIILIGQISQGYMITYLFDARQVFLTVLHINGFKTGFIDIMRTLTGYAVKFFALYVVFVQEKGRIVRWIYFELRKYDSGIYSYSLFNQRSPLIGIEQPESVYFMDKFIQPTHLYLHSNMHDYPETA